jgi:hypothetical protein
MSESREDSKAVFLSPEWAQRMFGPFGLATRASGDVGSGGGGREAKRMLYAGWRAPFIFGCNLLRHLLCLKVFYHMLNPLFQALRATPRVF